MPKTLATEAESTVFGTVTGLLIYSTNLKYVKYMRIHKLCTHIFQENSNNNIIIGRQYVVTEASFGNRNLVEYKIIKIIYIYLLHIWRNIHFPIISPQKTAARLRQTDPRTDTPSQKISKK